MSIKPAYKNVHVDVYIIQNVYYIDGCFYFFEENMFESEN